MADIKITTLAEQASHEKLDLIMSFVGGWQARSVETIHEEDLYLFPLFCLPFVQILQPG